MDFPDGPTCFECPLLRDVDRQLLDSQKVRDAAVDQLHHAMSEFAQMDKTDEQYIVMRLRVEVLFEEVLSLLDAANKTLNCYRIALLETCENMKPSVTHTLGEQALQCGSVLADQIQSELSPSS